MSIGCAIRTSWINESIFVEYLQHVVHHTRCPSENKTGVVLDNRKPHISLAAIAYARRNGVISITFSPYSSQASSPLLDSLWLIRPWMVG